ncbi:Ubiquitin carboxyl-terminal hydrolase 20 [Perkinsus chesapeaki]|uniref:Ubiquitin carboxyl-terminal hydrolase 20 n=1 Tax=Perkinsus chesapeaki TaxID=330153 RepID=A0A7J6KXQ6_PERCH|nr:Ubiquitin carboxyl-terminal hydrolase 20 [Perkinsus chesapeaki]
MEEQWGSDDSPDRVVPSSDACNPEAMLKAVQALSSMFQGYHQQETQEFPRCVLDAMDEELRRKVLKYPEAYLSVHMPEELPSPNAYSSVASEAAAESENSDLTLRDLTLRFTISEVSLQILRSYHKS